MIALLFAQTAAADFPQLDVKLGQVSAVAVDSRGQIFVFHRAEPPILVLDARGKLLRSFGQGLFKSSHGLRIDADDNIWTTDNANHTVVKFSNDGRVLLTLGERDAPGEDERHFNRPTDIAFAANGDFFISDGYGNSRVVKFDKTGKFLLAWGKKGKRPGEFNLPHAVRIDSKGLVYVGDRENKRVQVFDAEGRYVREFGGLAPYGLFIDPEDVLYAVDGVGNKAYKMDLQGKVLASWGEFNLPHSIHATADAIFTTEINGKRVLKFPK